jgi:hypothetical protein
MVESSAGWTDSEQVLSPSTEVGGQRFEAKIDTLVAAAVVVIEAIRAAVYFQHELR